MVLMIYECYEIGLSGWATKANGQQFRVKQALEYLSGIPMTWQLICTNKRNRNLRDMLVKASHP